MSGSDFLEGQFQKKSFQKMEKKIDKMLQSQKYSWIQNEQVRFDNRHLKSLKNETIFFT